MRTTLNFTNLWSVLALSFIAVRTVDTYQSAAGPGKGSKPNTASLVPTGGPPAASRRFPPRAATAPPTLRQEDNEPNVHPGSSNVSDVSVTCSASDFVVRVKPNFYGLYPGKKELKLGNNCESNGVLQPYGDLLFTYPLTECGAVRQPTSRHVSYKFVLHYEPSVRIWPKVDVDIECRYPRNYHVSKLIVQPTWKTAIMHKRLKGLRQNFHIELMDDTWSKPTMSRVYQLGSQINFQVSAFSLPHGAKVYISSCFAAPTSASGSSQKYIVIDNSGCLLDSKKEPGVSQFVSHTDDTLRFSLRAFQFVAEPETALKVQCQLLVTMEDPSPAHKSCTYRGNGWEALSGIDSICECCDSQCVTSKRHRRMKEGSATSQSLVVSNQPLMKEEGLSYINLTSSKDDGSATSHYIDLQSHDNEEGTDVDLYGKHKKDQDDSRNFDIDKQAYMGELLAKNKTFTVARFKDTESRYSLDKDISTVEGENVMSQPERVQKLNRKKTEQILLTEIHQPREQGDSEDAGELEEEEGNERMLNSEVKLRNGKELSQDGLRTWYFW